MKKTVIILVSLFILVSGFRVVVDTNSKMKAIFMLNFTKLIEWPPSYQKNDFIIGIIGDSPIYKELKKMAAIKKVGNQPIKVVTFANVNAINDCHILYVSANMSESIAAVVKKVKAQSTLIVTEKNGLVDRGAGINFIVKNNRQKFELNKGNVERHQLKINSTLEGLAFTVK